MLRAEMSVEIRWLHSFLAVAAELNFSRAARRLHLAQPALTAHIKQLEHAVGATLFHRTNRISGLTPAGEALLADSQAIVDRAQSLRETARRARDGESGRLRVGIIPPAAIRPVAEALRVFTRRFPAVEINAVQASQAQLIARLTDGELDLVLGRSSDSAKRMILRQRRLLVEEQGVVLREDDPLAGLSRIPLKRLHGTVLLLLRGNIHFGRNIAEMAAQNSVALTAQHAAEDFPSLYWMVRAGLGVAPCSLLLGDSLPRGLVVRPLRPAPPKLEIHALWCGPKLTAAAARLTDILSQSNEE